MHTARKNASRGRAPARPFGRRHQSLRAHDASRAPKGRRPGRPRRRHHSGALQPGDAQAWRADRVHRRLGSCRLGPLRHSASDQRRAAGAVRTSTTFMDTCPSGLREPPAKRLVDDESAPGFESRRIRHHYSSTCAAAASTRGQINRGVVERPQTADFDSVHAGSNPATPATHRIRRGPIAGPLALTRNQMVAHAAPGFESRPLRHLHSRAAAESCFNSSWITSDIAWSTRARRAGSARTS